MFIINIFFLAIGLIAILLSIVTINLIFKQYQKEQFVKPITFFLHDISLSVLSLLMGMFVSLGSIAYIMQQ